jgi:ribonuclease G
VAESAERPPEELFIQASPEETRVAVKAGERVLEVQVERTSGRGLSGNIYRGRVARVIPSMEAAFVDIGLDRAALLHAPDVWLPGQHAQHEDDEQPPRPQIAMARLLTPGQQILVQVVREPVGKKGPRITMFVSLPGRNAVLLARDSHVGVSKMIADPAERERLRSLVAGHVPAGCGAIVRTVGEGATEAEIADDLRLLAEQWSDIQARFDTASGPSFLYDDLDLTLRALRDQVGPHTQTVWIDDPGDYTRVERFVKRFHKDCQAAVRLWDGPGQLFEAHGIEKWVREAVEPKVQLPSGGELVISRTEAMTVIDVNSGRQTGTESLDEALLALNLEAAHEVAAQLRLRNIGGLVVVDFVDMPNVENRRALEHAFGDALARDRARVRVGKVSEFGTIELTRKRVRESLYERLTEPCPTCKSRGYVRSASDLAVEVVGRLRRAVLAAEGRSSIFRVQVPPRVHAIVTETLAGALRDLEKTHGCKIEVIANGGTGASDVRVVNEAG